MNNGFIDAMQEKILILDGAMGTMLQKYGLRGNNEEFNITHPEIVREIHEAYIAAGADIITSNTFGANRISQAGFGCAEKAGEFARAGAELARDAADAAGRKVFVAGSMGPTGKSLSLPLDISNPAYREVSFDEMAEAYSEQLQGLLKGGVDCLILETCFDALNTKAAIWSIMGNPAARQLPLIISASPLNKGGHLLTGQSVEGFRKSVAHARPLCFGLNCSMGAEDLSQLVGEVASSSPYAVSCYPNAGLPDSCGGYSQGPGQIASAMREMALNGWLNIAGGCCGTTPEHIRAIAEALKDVPPRKLPAGLASEQEIPSKAAELCVGSDVENSVFEAEDLVCEGADLLKIKTDDSVSGKAEVMEAFVRSIATDPYVSAASLCFDASDWNSALAGMKNFPGRCLLDCAKTPLSESQREQMLRLGAEVLPA